MTMLPSSEDNDSNCAENEQSKIFPESIILRKLIVVFDCPTIFLIILFESNESMRSNVDSDLSNCSERRRLSYVFQNSLFGEISNCNDNLSRKDFSCNNNGISLIV